jgi:Zn-dependent protease
VNLTFSARELRDFAVAWLALGVAFALFFSGGGVRGVAALFGRGLLGPLVVSLFTAGVGFLLHELGHKVVAVHFDQVAEFRADYGMLFLAVMSALVGFLFAAPGAVHHRGMLTKREHGLIALAGPAVNLVLAVVFAPLLLAGLVVSSPLVVDLGAKGLAVNLFLAAFNLVPYGPLDGRTVLSWSKLAWAVTFVPSAAVAVYVVFVLGIGFT